MGYGAFVWKVAYSRGATDRDVFDESDCAWFFRLQPAVTVWLEEQVDRSVSATKIIINYHY